jgi:hypothetical protein
MTSIIPIEPGIAQQKMTIQLENGSYDLTFRWNVRMERWFMSIGDAQGEILNNKMIALNGPILYYFSSRRLPPGEFMAVDMTSSNQPPGLNDFGSRVLMFYTDFKDL